MLNINLLTPMGSVQHNPFSANLFTILLLTARLYIVCEGPSAVSFHTSCVDISEVQLKSLTRGVVWMCEDCLPRFRHWKSHTAAEEMIESGCKKRSVLEGIDQLKRQVAGIQEAISSISSTQNTSTQPLHISALILSSSLMNGTRIMITVMQKSKWIKTICEKCIVLEETPLLLPRMPRNRYFHCF